MADPHIITTLRSKRDAIEATILAYQGKLDQARRDLVHVNATLALFASDDPGEVRAYTDTSRLFRRGEMVGLCKAALASHGPQGHGRGRSGAQEGAGLSNRPGPHPAMEAGWARERWIAERGAGVADTEPLSRFDSP